MNIITIIKIRKTISGTNVFASVNNSNNNENKYIEYIDYIMILIGLGKLWFGLKKITDMGEYLTMKNPNNNNNHINEENYSIIFDKFNLEIIKLWELLFENFPTMLLSIYILLLEQNWTSIAVIISLVISFGNASNTIICTVLDENNSKYNKDEQLKTESEINLSKLMKSQLSIAKSPKSPISQSQFSVNKSIQSPKSPQFEFSSPNSDAIDNKSEIRLTTFAFMNIPKIS